MPDEMLQGIWDEGREEPKMSKAEIEALLQPHIRKTEFDRSLFVWVYLVFIALTLVCEGMNMYAFRSNPVMLSAGLGMAGLTLGFLVYGIQMFREMAALDRVDASIVEKLRRRLRFQETRVEAWLWMIALTTMFLSFSMSTMLDAVDGRYRINNPLVFWGTLIGSGLIVYGALKAGQQPFVKATEAILADLEGQVTTHVERIAVAKRRWRVQNLVLVAFLTLMLLLGVLVSWWLATSGKV